MTKSQMILAFALIYMSGVSTAVSIYLISLHVSGGWCIPYPLLWSLFAGSTIIAICNNYAIFCLYGRLKAKKSFPGG